MELSLSPACSLALPSHEILPGTSMIGISGPSGSGKSTVLQYLYDRYCPKAHYMKQDIHLHPQLTVRETIEFYTALRTSSPDQESIDRVLREVGLEEMAGERVGSIEKRGISGGEKKRIMLAVAFLDPISDILLLDEPFSGLDDAMIGHLFGLLLSHRKQLCVLSFHQLPSHLREEFDEQWIVSEGRLIIIPRTEPRMIDIVLDPPPSTPPAPNARTPFWRQILLLNQRDQIIAQRQPIQTLMHMLMPIVIIGLQEMLIGPIRSHHNRWHNDPSEQGLELVYLVAVVQILFFTVSILPVSTLTNHFHRRSMILHEIHQGYFSENAYLWNAITTDQFLLMFQSLIIMMIQFGSFPLFFAIAMQMMMTNMLMWAFSSPHNASFVVVLLLLISYTSISFITNLGFLLRRPQLYFLQYISMVHTQSNLFLDSIHADGVLSYLNLRPLPCPPFLLSLLLYASPILFLVLSRFDLKKRRK